MLTLHVDAAAWRAHMKSTAAEYPALVPVAKGNGYGFGNARLATEAAQLGADTIAVGTLTEVADVTRVGDFSSILVLTPWYPGEPSDIATPPAVVRTVASLEGLEGLRGARVVLECLTSLRRHGIAYTDLGEIARLVDRVRIEGWAMHLPIDRFPGTDPVREVAQWVDTLQAGALPLATVYVSHLTAAEIARLSSRFPEVTFRARVGTQLWLGDRSFFEARGTVLDVMRMAKGDRYGYRQREAPSDGHLLVVSGGTSHGIGMEAPKAVIGAVRRAKVVAAAGLASMNRNLSPFTWQGKQRWFAEPPHMQVSLLWLPADVPPPVPGDELPADVRMTTTHFDRIQLV
jgi:hypothetical protein